MAAEKKKKKEEAGKVVLERSYNVPLRKEWLKVRKQRRSKKAVNALKEFLGKHMKSENVKIGKYANLEIWKHGIRNPPHHIKVNAAKDDKGVVKAELVGAPKEEKKKEKKKKEKMPAKGVKVEKKEGSVRVSKEDVTGEKKPKYQPKSKKELKKELKEEQK